MAFTTAITDVQDSSGTSLVVPNPDGTKPALALRLGAGLKVTFSKDGDRGVVLVSPDGSAPAASSSLTLGTPGVWTTTAVQAVYSDAAAHTLWSLAVAPGTNVHVRADIVANLGPGQVNANLAPSFWRRLAQATYTPAGFTVAQSDAADGNSIMAPFVSGIGGLVAGSSAFVASGSNITLQVQGFPNPSAWQATHAYNVGDFVSNGGKIYVCDHAGTSAGSGGPTGTGVAIVDGGAHWDYVATGSTVPVGWTASISYLAPA